MTHSDLPIFQYQGPLHLITSPKDVDAAVKKLMNHSLLGFDTETKPAFTKGESYLPCLLQLASEEECFLFRLNLLGIPDGLIKLFTDKNILKAGVAIRDDLIGLRKKREFKPQGFVEIADLARQQGHEKLGLRSLTEELMGMKVSKKIRTSNWERQELTPAQMSYAAGDAYLGLKLFEILNEKNATTASP